MLNVPQEVKELFNQSSVRKFLRINFPNGEMEDLYDKNIMYESMTFDESICSTDNLEFGLAEASILKFTTVNNVPNFKDATIKAYICVEIAPVVSENHYEKNFSVEIAPNVDEYEFLFNDTNDKTISFSWLNRKTGEFLVEETEYHGDTKKIVEKVERHDGFTLTNVGVICGQSVTCFANGYKYPNGYKPANKHVDYAYYEIPLGQFYVKECKKQSDMSKRSVTAYSNYINADFPIYSNFEIAKMEAGSKTNTDYIYNPVKYALASVSQNVDFDFDEMGIFHGTPYKNFVDTSSTHKINNTYYAQNKNNVRVLTKIKLKRIDLSLFYPNLIAYKFGVPETSTQEIRDLLMQIYERYADRLGVGQSAYKDLVKYQIDKCEPNVLLYDYSANAKNYNSKNPIIKNNGFLDTDFSNSEALSKGYYIYVPYHVDIEVFISDIFGDKVKQVLESYSFDFYNPDNIYIEITSLENTDFKLPIITEKINRVKNKNNSYSVDTSNLPDVSETFKGILELNGLYFVQDRESGKYKFLNLSGANAVVYPLETLYPSEVLYPGETDLLLKPDNYYTAWYDDYSFENYASIVINYRDDKDEEHNLEVHDPIYDEEYGEPIVTQVVDSTEVMIDTRLKPFTNGDTLYFSAEGLAITEISAAIGGNPREILFSGRQDKVILTDSIWESYTSLYVNLENAPDGYSIKIGRYSYEEIQIERKTLDLSENYLIQNFKMEDIFIQKIMRQCLDNIKDVSFVPCNVDLKGLPYAQAGDSFAVSTTNDDNFVGIILRRTLSGINALKDTYTCD